jgi:hypothetical protein
VDDDDWRDAIPDEAPPFFFHVKGDVDHGVDVVGRDGGGLFCIDDDEHDRSVWWVSESNPGSSHRFVNTSVERFRDSMGLFHETWRSLRGLTDEHRRQRLAALRRQLAAIETAPSVLVEPDDYWQVILAQVEEGLL